MTVAHDLVHAPAATKIVSAASATATRKVAAGGSGALPHVILGPESWDQRAGRVVTRRWDKTVRTGELGLENWNRRVGTIDLGESGPGVGNGARQL